MSTAAKQLFSVSHNTNTTLFFIVSVYSSLQVHVICEDDSPRKGALLANLK
jgi:hypothetical protein